MFDSLYRNIVNGTLYRNIVSEQRIGTLLMEPLPTKSLLIRTSVRLLPGQRRDTNKNVKQQILTNTDTNTYGNTNTNTDANTDTLHYIKSVLIRTYVGYVVRHVMILNANKKTTLSQIFMKKKPV